MEKFKTGHEIFDEISSFPVGSFISVLDKTHFESSIFLNALLSSNKNQKRHVCLLSPYHIESPFGTVKLDLQRMSLQEISIAINKLREDLKCGVIIHNYLPHLLVKESEELVLKMIESWYGKSTEKETTEFFTLPKETFLIFEKKFNSLTYGSIEITIRREKDVVQQFLSISRACKPEYHMREFQYMVKDNKLLIKWGDEFTDTLPKEEELIIKEKVNYLKTHLHSLKLSSGSFGHYNLSLYEQLLFSQIIEKRLDDVQTLFPETFEELLRKIAIWNIKGLIKPEEVEEIRPKLLKNKLKLSTRIAFSLPTKISLLMLYGRPASVPADCYLALKKAAESFANILTETTKTSVDIKFEDLENFFQEMAGRIASMEHITKAHEDPQTVKLDISYLPKMVSLSLFHGWRLKPEIKKDETMPDTYYINLRKCFLCKDVKSERSACKILSSIIVGMCSIVFKEKFSCEEIKCKAMGHESCVFLLKKL
ncbi:MAG: 4-vinyl reductase [Candidatus Bathyarchaeia archaeon]